MRNYFTKSMFNGHEFNDMERGLFKLPAKYGGLGIINTSRISNRKYRNSRILTLERSQLMKNQDLIYDVTKTN